MTKKHSQLASQNVPVLGMHCASCASTIQRTLQKIDGVEECSLNYATEKAKVVYDPQKVSPDQLNAAIEPLGYSIDFPKSKTDHEPDSEHHHHHSEVPTSSRLSEERNKALIAFPMALIVFALMMWEIVSKYIPVFPEFMIPMRPMQGILFLMATFVLFGLGRNFLRAVVTFAKTLHANMDTLIGIGTLTAYLYSTTVFLFPEMIMEAGLSMASYFDVTIVVIGFIIFGKFLEARSKYKTGEALRALLSLQAKTALVRKDGREVEVPVEQVTKGMELIVKPGAKVPVDGTVIEGNSAVDESLVTGESLPQDKSAGDAVIGGTINSNGVLIINATKVGDETLLAQITQMVEDAQGSKAPIEKLVDQISAVFVPTVLVIAVISLLLWLVVAPQFIPFDQAVALGLKAFVGILVIACPCALGLATPTAMIVGVGRAAKHGMLIKDAESLEKLHRVDTVVVDKTGTLTEGRPAVSEVITTEKMSEKKVLATLAALEQFSEHPIARAIVEAVSSKKFLSVDQFTNLEGRGVKGKIDGEWWYAGNLRLLKELGASVDESVIAARTAEGKTPVFLISHKKVQGIVLVADQLKATAIEAVASLHEMGVQVVMMSGDDQRTAEYIGSQVGIDQVHGQVLPADKASLVAKLQQEGKIVAMVGDGVNDAPALATADVGIAMSTGTDVAISTAHLTLLHGDITKVAEAIKLSKATMRIIRQNLFWAFIYNVIGIPLAAGALYPLFGLLLNPVFAGFAMAMSSVSVVTNSLRLRRVTLE